MKQLRIQFEENGTITLQNKESIFVEEGTNLEVRITNYSKFNTIHYAKEGVLIPLEVNRLVIPSHEILDGLSLMFNADGNWYELKALQVDNLKLVGGALTDKYPQTITNLIRDVKHIFEMLKDYDTIKSDIADLKKIASYLYEEIEEKEVIR